MPADRRPLRAVLFDMDGVLLDTEPLYTEATRRIVGRFGKTYDWALKADMMGRSAAFGAAELIRRLDLPLTTEEYLSERDETLRGLFRAAPAKPGAAELVGELRRRGYRLAVATSSPSSLFTLKTAPHPWFGDFDAIVTASDSRLERTKPAPDIFLLAASDLGVTPDQCMVVEDSPAGAEAAVAANMRLTVLRDPNVPESRFPHAELMVTSFAELPAAWPDGEHAPTAADAPRAH